MGREGARRCFQPVAQVFRTAVACQVHEEEEARGPFNQGGNGRAAALSNDEVVFLTVLLWVISELS